MFELIEVCLYAPYSNATLRHFSHYRKLLQQTGRANQIKEKKKKSVFCVDVEDLEILNFNRLLCSKVIISWWNDKEEGTNQGKRRYKEIAKKQRSHH